MGHHHEFHHRHACGHLPHRCHSGHLVGGAMHVLGMGAGLMAAARSACHSHHDSHECGCDTGQMADILICALPGERRIIPYQVRNDTACPITVHLKIEPFSRCGSGEPLDAVPVASPPGPFAIPACGSQNFELIVETKGLEACQCYCTTLHLEGTRCEPVTIALCMGGKVPAVSRHDVSRLRAWVRSCCFGKPGYSYLAPPPLVSGCRHHCGD